MTWKIYEVWALHGGKRVSEFLTGDNWKIKTAQCRNARGEGKSVSFLVFFGN